MITEKIQYPSPTYPADLTILPLAAGLIGNVIDGSMSANQ